MANADPFPRLTETEKLLASIDETRLIRPEVGSLSRGSDFSRYLSDIKKRLRLIREAVDYVHSDHMRDVVNPAAEIVGILSRQAGVKDQEYPSSAEANIQQLKRQLDDIRSHWPNVIAGVVEARGLDRLDDLTATLTDLVSEKARELKRAFDETEAVLRKEARDAIDTQLRPQIDEAVQQARKIVEDAERAAKQREEEARLREERIAKTASGVSVEVAQEQFNAAAQSHLVQMWIWGLVGFAAIGVFFGVAFYFKANVPVGDSEEWFLAYHTVLRITILTAIAAIATFSMKILRAQMHMRAHNMHRLHLANSMAAFVESASNPEQRDYILARLIDAVAAFGSSGLLEKEDDSLYASKMMIDTINRTISSPSK